MKHSMDALVYYIYDILINKKTKTHDSAKGIAVAALVKRLKEDE